MSTLVFSKYDVTFEEAVRLRRNLIREAINVELLKFKDGIRHIDKCHLPPEDAHRMKNRLARIYAEHITTMLVPQEDRDG